MAHYLPRMATAFTPATLARSHDLRKLSWNCLSLRTQNSAAGSLDDVDMVLLVSLTRLRAFSRAI